MITLTLVRHAESTDNVRHIRAGWKDSPLSNHGMNQARALGVSFATLDIKAIYSSPLQRAYFTALQIFQAGDSVSIIRSDLLREQNFGISEGQPWIAAHPNFAPHGHSPVAQERDTRFMGGESRGDVADRAARAIDELIMPHIYAAEGLDAGHYHVVMISHGIFISELVSELLRRRGLRQCDTPYCSGLSNTGWTRLLVSFEDDGRVREAEDAEAKVPRTQAGKRSAFAISTARSTSASHCMRLHAQITVQNYTSHLEKLRRQTGGIGSAAFDAKQRTLHEFFLP